jgi:hypothetical protein
LLQRTCSSSSSSSRDGTSAEIHLALHITLLQRTCSSSRSSKGTSADEHLACRLLAITQVDCSGAYCCCCRCW